MPAAVSNTVTLKGNPVALTGAEVKIGRSMPDCTLVANDMSLVKLSSFKGKKLIISAVPSLDTPVCDIETKRFNQEAAKLGDDVKVLTISLDLPFAQKRWCAATHTDKVQTLSDYREAEFGKAFGVLIQNPKLLARAIFVIDQGGVVRYKQIVPEVTQEPNYEDTINAVKQL